MIKIGDKEFRNLEEQVGFLSTRAQLSTLGLSLVGIVPDQSSLPQEAEERQVYAVGAEPPYEYFVYLSGVYSSLGVFPLAGPPGVPGDRGKQGPAGPIGPKGDKGNQGIAGPAGGGVGVDHISTMDLSTGSAVVSYEQASGATLTKQGQITAAGTNYNITVNDKIPIIAGDNVNIAANGTNSAIKVSANVPVKSVNGQTGAVTISVPTKNSQLTNDSGYITNSYHDSTKQDTLVSGENIKTINNQSILGPGNITINGGGGGGGTDTGFDNVSRIEAADDHTTYNPDTKEYVITSGYADIFYKDNTKIRIPYVQGIGLMAGDNVTFTEELVDETNWRLKINATGGGSASDGFNNLSELTIAASQYASPQSAAGPFYFTGSGTASWKDGSVATSIPKIDIQLGCEPGAGISFKAKGEGAGASCEIGLTDFAMLDLGEFSSFPVSNQELTVEQAELIEQHKYSFIKFRDPNGWNNGAGSLDVYCVPVDNALGHGGITYKSITTQGNTYTVNVNIQRTTGEAFQSKTYSITKEATSGGGGATYSVVEITPETTTLTDEQYNTLIASPFNKIKSANIICDLYQETAKELIYTANYFNSGYRVTITKATKGVTSGSLSSLTSISAYVKNSLDYNKSNTTYALSAYQGKVLNDRLTAVENGGGGALYQHTITYSSDKFNSMEDFSGESVSGSFCISFYSTHGHFENASDFWAWLIGRGSINVCDGQLWGSMGGGEAFTRITVLGETDADKYIKFQTYGGYGEWNSINWYVKNTAATGLTDTIIDGFRDM